MNLDLLHEFRHVGLKPSHFDKIQMNLNVSILLKYI